MSLTSFLLVLHVATLGYWLGSEVAINKTFRYVCLGKDLPFPQRDALLDHVLNLDQHVRYALILQLGSGFALMLLYGWLPFPEEIFLNWIIVITVVWLVLVELTHRLRKERMGKILSRIDYSTRFLMMLLLLGLSIVALRITIWSVPLWLAGKLFLFAVIILCGVLIRQVLVRFYRVWHALEQTATDTLEQQVVTRYRQATGVLWVLWGCILGIVVLSLLKPL